MNLRRLDVPQSFATCSRVFYKPDVLSEVMGLLSKSQILRSSVSTRGSANHSSRRSAAGSVQSSNGSMAHPARVLSAGQPISDRYAENSDILLQAGQ